MKAAMSTIPSWSTCERDSNAKSLVRPYVCGGFDARMHCRLVSLQGFPRVAKGLLAAPWLYGVLLERCPYNES